MLAHLFVPVWALLCALTPSRLDLDESCADRATRLAPAAYWCTVYAQSRDELAACITLGIHESRWARYVGEGRCRDGPQGERCDPDRHGRPRARGWWQLHRSACPALWRTPLGSSEAIQAGARCAVAVWRGALWRCRGRHPAGPLAGAYAGYRGLDCEWPGGVRRARTHGWVLVGLGRLPDVALAGHGSLCGELLDRIAI